MMDDFNGYAMVPREEDYFGDVEFMLYTYKVERCMISQPHAWKNCPFVHHQEPIKRRHPTLHMAHLCPLVKKGQTCPDDKCCWAHNAFELWLHPERYKTIMCRKGAGCGRGICFFAHSESELRVPTKAKAVDLSNPAAAAGAVGAALKFKAVAQALPNAAISAAPVSGKRSPMLLQGLALQKQQSLGLPAMSLGLPAMSLGLPDMPPGVPTMSLGFSSSSASLPMSLGAAALPGPSAVPQQVSLSGLSQGTPMCNPMAVPLDLGYVNGTNSGGINGSDTAYMNGSNFGYMTSGNTSRQHSQHMSWASSASSASTAAPNSADSSSHSRCSSSSSTRLDAGDCLLSDLYACTAGTAGGNSTTANGANAAAPSTYGQQHNGIPAAMHAGLLGAPMGGFAAAPQQLPQQPLLMHLAQAAAAVRAEVENGVGAAAGQEAALQAAADRVAALLFTGPFGGLCAGGDYSHAWQTPGVHEARKTRSFDLHVGGTAVAMAQQQQQLVRTGSA